MNNKIREYFLVPQTEMDSFSIYGDLGKFMSKVLKKTLKTFDSFISLQN